MIKLVFKNLWNRRGKYAWLFIELIIVTALSWYIIDPVVVSIADASLPLGYDAERLAIVRVSTLPENNPAYAASEADSSAQAANFERLMYKIRNAEGVERAAAGPYRSEINGGGISIDQYRTRNPADSALRPVNMLIFWPGQEYFETLGLKSVPGSPDIEELSATARNEKAIIITESYARLFWPDGDGAGKYFYNRDDSTRVAGVVSDIRYQNFNRTNCAGFPFWSKLRFPLEKFNVTVRLKPGVDPGKWAKQFADNARKHINTGNYYVSQAIAQTDIIAQTESTFGISNERNTKIILAIFFLINLVLGVIGSFYLQTRRRIAEMGVHRSFGARPADIFGMLTGEGIALTVIAFIVGDALYLQYALKFGVDTGFGNNAMYNIIDNWVTNFNAHFAIISAVVLAVLLVCVLAGILLPALKISRINPVEALRDE